MTASSNTSGRTRSTSEHNRKTYLHTVMTRPIAFTRRLPSGCRIFYALVRVALLGALPASVLAQAATGSVNGRVFNPATGEYVRNVEVALVGTAISTLTEEGGVYRLPNAPTGAQTIEVRYTGYDTARETVNVTAGREVTKDFELKGSADTTKRGGEVVTLSAFTVSTEREGNAKAIMEQKGAMNVKTVVATDTFGDIAEGNIGEFLKFMPGITLDYVETDTRAARMGGLEARYGAVTLDGSSMANTITGGFGGDSRQFEQQFVSINICEAIAGDKTFTVYPLVDAPGAKTKTHSKCALDPKGVQFIFTAVFNGNHSKHESSKTPRHADDKHMTSLP